MSNIIKAKSYLINNNGEWGVFVLDCEHNTVFSHTTYGDYNYSWHAHGCDNLAHFLLEIDIHYAMGKFKGMTHKVLDDVATDNYIKEMLIEDRRDNAITQEQAREAWDHIEQGHVDYTNGDTFYHTICENETLYMYVADDGLSYQTKMDNSCERFWEMLWKPFLELIKQDEIYNWKQDG